MSDSYVFLEDSTTQSRRFYDEPLFSIVASQPNEVGGAFDKIIQALSDGLYVAGYASYELGYVLEKKLQKKLPNLRGFPLVNFAAFQRVRYDYKPQNYHEEKCFIEVVPTCTEEQYTKTFKKVMNYINSGEVYQLNLTFPMEGEYSGDPINLYDILIRQQPVKYGGIVALGNPVVLSLSPELFFSCNGTEIKTSPMKGTIRRGNTKKEDRELIELMSSDEKSRAENLMIVDLLRNDLSKISVPGSVKVTDLFKIETFPTLHQMTSSIKSQLNKDINITDLFRSLFPCGSVTGAPKIRAMELISELEVVPRGVYCGAIGYIDPGGYSCFNVAIRTASLFKDGEAFFNVGSGIVYDSISKAEYEECLLKTKLLEIIRNKRR